MGCGFSEPFCRTSFLPARVWLISFTQATCECTANTKPKLGSGKKKKRLDDSTHFCPGDGLELEAYPLPSSRLSSSLLRARIFLGYLIGTLLAVWSLTKYSHNWLPHNVRFVQTPVTTAARDFPTGGELT